jgi:hypothetical protein
LIQYFYFFFILYSLFWFWTREMVPTTLLYGNAYTLPIYFFMVNL